MFGYLIAFILGFVFCKYLKPLQQRIFPILMNNTANNLPKEFLDFKAKNFKELKSMKSHFPKMQERNSIKILEIGVGTGANFSLYPDGCHLTVVDPNPHFQDYYDTNKCKFPQIKSEEFIVCGGEDMYAVPDCSVDAVVVTWVLCSVRDTSKIMEQVKRVLVPGGKFFFFEHVKEWDTEKQSKRIWWQFFLTKIGLWPTVFDGCELNRDTLPFIQNAGFSKVDYEREYAPIPDPKFSVIQPHVFGVATK